MCGAACVCVWARKNLLGRHGGVSGRGRPRWGSSRAHTPSPSAVAEKSTGSILDDIGSMFDDLADQLDAMLE